MNKPLSQKCESPVCDVEFEPSGPKVRPKRFCSAACAMQMSVIRRAVKLLAQLGDEEIIEVVRDQR
jgi:hypothetical protein